MTGLDQNAITGINKSALNFHISNVGRFQELCDPLKHLGITTFGYRKIFDDSRYLVICNHDEWSRYFFHNSYSGSFFPKIFSLVDSRIMSFIWPHETTDNLLLALKSHNIFHGITFSRRMGDFIENWSFGAPSENTEVYDLYLRRQDLLWKFIHYFNESAQDLMDHSNPGKLGIYRGGHNISPSKNFPEKDNIKKFLQEVETKKYFMKCNRNWTFVSEKEKQCLELASKGLKRSDQAGLSPDVIDGCLNEIKIRLGATGVKELLDAFEINPDARAKPLGDPVNFRCPPALKSLDDERPAWLQDDRRIHRRLSPDS